MKKPKKNQIFSVDQIVAWANNKLGIPAKDTYKSLKICERTYNRYVKAIDRAVGKKIDSEKLYRAILMLYPLAFNSLAHLLKKKHPMVTIAFLKGIRVLKEESKEGEKKHSQIIQIINNIPDTLGDNVKSGRDKRFKLNDL